MAGVEEEALFVAGPVDDAVAWGAVDVNIQDGEEDADFQGRPIEGGIMVEAGDFGDFAIGGSNHDVGGGRNRAIEIAIKSQAGESQDGEENTQPPHAREYGADQGGQAAADEDGEPIGPAVEGEEKLGRVACGDRGAHGIEYGRGAQGCKGIAN